MILEVACRGEQGKSMCTRCTCATHPTPQRRGEETLEVNTGGHWPRLSTALLTGHKALGQARVTTAEEKRHRVSGRGPSARGNRAYCTHTNTSGAHPDLLPVLCLESSPESRATRRCQERSMDLAARRKRTRAAVLPGRSQEGMRSTWIVLQTREVRWLGAEDDRGGERVWRRDRKAKGDSPPQVER